jgi:ubiquinone/menaquinone biosynthesis C-methylase UbiE
VQYVGNPLAFFLKFFFHLLYNPFASSYDRVAAIVSRGRWIRWTYATLPYLTGERILELGHGPGHLQKAMNERGWQVFGLDLSQSMGRLAQQQLIQANQPHRLVRGTARYLPFPTAAFDQIVATFPSEYLFQSQTLAEIRRVLCPGGLLVVLPVAWIGRGSSVERGLESLFRVTHQAPERTDEQWKIRMLEPFKQAGFEVRSETVTLNTSEIFILLAGQPNLL